MEGEPEQAYFHPRRSFRRQNSAVIPESYERAPQEDHEFSTFQFPEPEEAPDGLNISGLPKQVKRVPVGSKSSKHGSTTLVTTPEPLFANRDSPYHQDAHSWKSGRSSYSRLNQSTSQDFSTEAGLLHNDHDKNCPTHGDILTSPWSWWTVSILALALYSTVFSGVFLGIAFVKPRWGERIGTNGHITFSNATLLSALLSKTVELSFVTVFVALLGQMLSRRAFAKTRKGGISIAEMNMRSWVMQPGTLITNWIAVRYAASTIVGILVLVAALAATFYTTAAEALVAPKPKLGALKSRALYGEVAMSYANAPYLARTCETPVVENPNRPDLYPEGDTCLQIDYAGQSFHNFKSFMSDWSQRLDVGNMSTDASSIVGRPSGISTLFGNTTLQGQWITPSHENITHDTSKWSRVVQNVTLAMPHANLFNAARDPRNHILQPEDLQGSGEYFIQAALPAPMINVLCAGLNSTEVEPFISTNTSASYFPPKSVVDDIFDFGPTGYVGGKQQAPTFPKVPLPYNILGFISSGYGYPSVYILAAPPPDQDSDRASYLPYMDYMLCGIRSAQYRNCTTYYHVAQSGGQMSVECDKSPGNTLSYFKSVPDATIGHWEPDWKDIGGEWLRAISMTSGVDNANASNARLLTQFIPPYANASGADAYTYLPIAMPTIGEALAVLAGSTAVLASTKAPFVHFWNYSRVDLPEPQYQNFRAMVSYKDYASGGTQEWQGLFYVVLVVVFLLSCFSLVYLLWTFCLLGRVTDYTEPQNLFALAINSPPSAAMSGTCGAGPSGGILAKKWEVDMQKGASIHTDRNAHPHFYVRCRDDDTTPETPSKRRKRRSKPPTIASFSIAESPAVEQYMRLSGKG